MLTLIVSSAVTYFTDEEFVLEKKHVKLLRVKVRESEIIANESQPNTYDLSTLFLALQLTTWTSFQITRKDAR